ncbi:prolipoprotein diacylglyceryl transferase [Horticoccus sp. 23ND18S-11]|uniref:prolipoprotein diacylglyceryl transferase n=1 Tax=Horticoccus sp. 23ND18S-11 TaxID=3391832 RepID=UPI0039C976C9
MPLAYWVHTWDPFFIEFSDGVGIRYYGLAYLAGFVAAAWLLFRYHKAGRSPFDLGAIIDLMTYIVAGVLLGGRLGYFALYQMDSVRSDPMAIFRVWEGGMASHGGFLGVLIAMAWWARKRTVTLFRVSDLIVTVTPAGLLFGRIANFINGELYGKIADVPWAVIFPQSAAPGQPLHLILPRHPSQLYEAALEGVVLLALMQWRFWRTDVARAQPGRLSGEFLIAYSALRMIGELFREPDASLLLGVSRGTFYSVFLIVAGVLIITRTPKATART